MYEELKKYRRQKDKLSFNKLDDVLQAYWKYHQKYEIDENKQVYMTKEELNSLQ
ncbi:MAG: hypothetical protein NC355_02155 [Blautia sp.]|nr:hypothetical protein [Blautia sp.]